jgi:hypothetical protein
MALILRLVRAHRKGEVTRRRRSARRGVDRRRFLHASALTAAVFAIPGWAETFGDGPTRANNPSERSLLLRSIDVARARGRPLLILHVPTARMAGAPTSAVWSEYLANASNESLLDLALCDLVCAFDVDVQRDLANVAGREWRSSLAILVEPEEPVSVLVPALTAKLTSNPTEAVYEAEARALRTEMHERLHAVIAPDVRALEVRARANRAALDAEAIARLGDLDKVVPVGAEHAALVPAWVSLRAASEPLVRAKLHNLLLDQVGQRIRLSSPPGAEWGRPDGCGGVVLESLGHQFGSGPCGTGFMSAGGKRFLYFYTEAKIEEMRREKQRETKR